MSSGRVKVLEEKARDNFSADVPGSHAIFMIVGLGNPGTRFAHSRHNAGYRVASAFSERHSISLRRKRFLRSRVGQGEVAGRRVVAVVPTTFMNRSGEAAARAVGFYGVHPKNLLVIVDDVNLPLGQLRIKAKGTDGGHNGLRSVIASLGTTDFPRLRVGIGREDSSTLTDFVLGDFGGEEKTIIEAAIQRAVEAVETTVVEGVSAAMNRYNQSFRPSQAHYPPIQHGCQENDERRTSQASC